MARRAVVLAVLCVGCNGGGDRADTEVKLRVSASHGVGQLVPGPELSGAAAYALPLVYEPLGAHATVDAVEGRTVILSRKPESPHSAAELAGALRYRGLEEAEADGDRIKARFSTRQAARRFAGWEYGAFDLGPFEVERSSSHMIRLRARDDLAIDVLEIVTVHEEQQWRRLLARNVDVVPLTDATRAARLADVGSIRVLPYPRAAEYGLVFNVRDQALKSASVRRTLARAIDATAVARVACGDKACAAPASVIEAPAAEDVSLPDALSLLILESDDVARLAAETLRLQLGRRGVTIAINEESAGEAFARVAAGRYQLALVPVSSEPGPHLLRQLANYGFASDELSAAIARGDEKAARAILAREVPFATLFEARYFAAIDDHFCGGEPTHHTSWRWLADLHPCEEGP